MIIKAGKLRFLGIILVTISLLVGVYSIGMGKQKPLIKGSSQKTPIFGQDVSNLGYVPGQILVKFKPSITQRQILSINRKFKTNVIKEYTFPNGLAIHLLALPETIRVSEAVDKFKQEPAVEYAEPDYKVHILGQVSPSNTPNDPYFNDLWGLNNTGQTGGTSDADIDAPEAWNICNGSDGIVIADIDTGIDINHPDLAANIWTNLNEIPGNGIDDDGNGYIDDIHGWDFVNEDNTVYDGIDDHGTHTAGTIGAVGNNGIGVTGVNWNVKVMPLKFLEYNSGNTSDAIEAFSYVAKMGVKITSNSWGYVGGPEQAMKDAIDASGALCIFAAGNSSMDNDAGYPDYTAYPSSYPLDNIISVAATDHNDELASFSNWGAATVDLAAPGVNIKSTVPTDHYNPPYASFQGTSMATPHVAGVAGLLMAKFPDNSILEIKQMILGSVDSKGNLQGLMISGGRLNAYSALSGIIPPIIDEASANPTAGAPPLTVSFTGSAHDVDGNIVEHHWNFGDGETSNEWNPVHTYQTGGTYAATLFVTDNDGGTSSRGLNIQVMNPANVLLIDDDQGYSYETYFTDALDACGISYQVWDVELLGPAPSLTGISSLFNVVIWNTSWTYNSTLTSNDQSNLAAYLDAGGKLFLSSQDLIWDAGVNSFVKNYLHVSSAIDDVGANKVVGVTGDPITNGLNINLSCPWQDYSDKIVPDTSAAGIFTNESGQLTALRYAGGYRVVFFAFLFESIPSGGTAPNNSATVMQRIYNWLTEGSTPPPNNPPSLSWTGETGYQNDGLEPESGTTETSFAYRVKYTDVDNDSPQTGYPKVHILKGGEEIQNSPFTMSEVDSGDTNYTNGKLYTFSKQNLSVGSNYTYYFGAKDNQGSSASGEPTSPKTGPEVVDETTSLTLTSPNGGETLLAGSTHNITWSSQGKIGDNVKLEYSTDSGENWVTIISSTPNNSAYSWVVPDTSSSHCLVKVSSLPNFTYSDVSDAEFAIVSGIPATATRTISPEEVEPGKTFEVTVKVTANQDIAGLGLNENLTGFPDNWSPWDVTPINNDGATFNESEVQWVWLQVNSGETKQIKYMVKVPSNLPGDFSIEGSIKSCNPVFEQGVTGDSQVKIPAVYVSRTITPNSISAGNSFNVTVNIQVLVDAEQLKVDENLTDYPANWSPWDVTPIDNDGATFNSSNVSWVWSQVSGGQTKKLIYKVSVSEGTSSGTYQLQGTVSGSSPEFSYPIPGDNTITVDENQPPVAQFTYNPSSSDGVHTDEEIQFNDQSYDPDGSIVQWAWQFADGATSSEENPSHTYVYSPSSPIYSSNPEDVIKNFNVILTVSDNEEAQSSTNQSITVYLTVPRSAANYYSADDLFDMDEILQTISWWSNGDEVPFTNGRIIDMDTMLTMIAKWSTRTPVGSSLSTTPEENPEDCITVTRTISRVNAYPGQSFKVTLSLAVNQDIAGLGIDEGLAQTSGEWGNWQVKSVDSQDAVFNSQDVEWLWLNLKEGDTRSLVYEVKVPEDTLPGEYDIQGLVMSHLPEIALQVRGDSEITVASEEETSPVVYPNPCSIEHKLKFSQVAPESNIFIYTVSGEEVVRLKVPAGEYQLEWNLCNQSGEKVERGTYIYLVISSQGKKYTGKIAIIK